MTRDSRERGLSRRERQIMDVLFRDGQGGVAQVRDQLPDPPSYSAVRALLRVLEEKGHVKHEQDGARYVYQPTTPIEEAGRSALKRLLSTFFNDSPERAIKSLLDLSAAELTDEELQQLELRIAQARREGR